MHLMTMDNGDGTSGNTPEDAASCDPSVLPPAAREEHIALARSSLCVSQAVNELPDGVSFESPSSRFDEVARFVGNQRRCCAHLGFVIEVPPRGAALALRITGTGAGEGLAAITFPPDPIPTALKRP